jgi:hypothetical protein
MAGTSYCFVKSINPGEKFLGKAHNKQLGISLSRQKLSSLFKLLWTVNKLHCVSNSARRSGKESDSEQAFIACPIALEGLKGTTAGKSQQKEIVGISGIH